MLYSAQSKISFGSFDFDPETGELYCDSMRLSLMPKDSDVLLLLLEKAERLVTKEEFIRQIWEGAVVSDDVLKACIKRIRKVLNDDYRNPKYIETIKRRGYRFCRQIKKNQSQNFFRSEFSEDSKAKEDCFVGREKEFQILIEKLASAVQGIGRTLFITGKAGIGKSFLLKRFVDDTISDQQILLLEGHCIKDPETREAYYPFLNALQDIQKIQGKQYFKEMLRCHAPSWLIQFPWLMEKNERMSILTELQGSTNKKMLRELTNIFTFLTEKQPVVLIVEDLHWADQATLVALSILSKSMQRSKLLIIGSFRGNTSECRGLSYIYSDMLSKKLCTSIELPLLNESDLQKYVNSLVGNSPDRTILAKWLYQNTEGLPLFVSNLLQFAFSKGWLNESDHLGPFFLEKKINTLVVPDNLSVLLNNKIDQLSLIEQDFLETCSVVGNSFNICFFDNSSIHSTRAVEKIAETLANDSGFLERADVKTFPDGSVGTEYSFVHSWYPKVLYERIPPYKCSMIHRMLGEKLEKIYQQEAATKIAPTLAKHFENSGNIRKAIKYRQAASQTALCRFAFDEVTYHLGKGLEMLGKSSENVNTKKQELELLIPLGAALVVRRGYAYLRVEQIYNRAHELCLQADQTPDLLPILFGLCMYYLVKGEFDSGDDLRELFITVAHQENKPDMLPWGYALHCLPLWYKGRHAESSKYAELVTKDYDPYLQRNNSIIYGSDAGITCILHNSLTQWIIGFPKKASLEMRRALELAGKYGNPFTKAWSFCFAGWLATFNRDLVKVEKYAKMSLDLSAEYGIDYWNIQATVLLSWARGLSGGRERLVNAIEIIKNKIHAHRLTGARLIESKLLFMQAECLGENNDTQEALSCINKALQSVEDLGESWWKPELLRLKGELLEKQFFGNNTFPETVNYEIEALYSAALQIAKGQHAKSLELRATMKLSGMFYKRGEQERAKKLLVEVYTWFSEGFDTYDLREAKKQIDMMS